MLSGKLIHLIEAHQEEIATNIIREIRDHSDLPHYQKLPDAELRQRGQHILEHLGHWLSAGHETEIEQYFEKLGKARYEESIPLHEAVLALAIIKNKMIDFVHFQVLSKTSMELYAEEELERRIGRFFDALTVRMVQGYETAWRHAARVAV